MKNKNTECCSTKMNKSNIFIGLLIGLAVLVFGGQILLKQNPLPEAKPLDQAKVDQMINAVQNNTDTNEEVVNFAGVWTTEGEDSTTLTLNEDGTVADMEGGIKWNAEGSTVTLTNADGVTTETFKLTDGNLVSGETVYKK